MLIDRPDNQQKFAEIESRLAAKGLISHQQLLNNNNLNQNIIKQQLIKTNQITNGDNDYTSQQAHLQQLNNGKNKSIHQTQLIFTSAHDLSNRSKRNNTLTSDGRSAEDDFNQTDGYSPTIRSEPDGQPSLNKSLVESKSSSGNSSGSSPPPQAPNPIVIEMYENLAQELKAKLSNKQAHGPLLLPPRDYDTVCRSQGKLVEQEKRACTNKLLVGKVVKKNEKVIANKKSDNLVLDTKEEDYKKVLEVKDSAKIDTKVDVKDVKVDLKKNETKVAAEKNDLSNTETLEMNKLKKLNKNEIGEQEKRLNYQQISEKQKQYELKLKNLQRSQEIYEQHQLLIEQQKQVRREFSQQHKPSKFVEEMANGKLANIKTNSKEQIKIRNSIEEEIQSSSPTSKSTSSNNNETTSVIHTGGIKQIGSNLANKIKQSLIGSNKEKLQPQLIYHKTIHDSLQSLNKLPNNDKYLNKNLKLAKNSNNKQSIAKQQTQQQNKDRTKEIVNTNTASTSTSKSKLSNSSSNISNEKLNTINNRSDSSSGIGSAANLANTSPNHKAAFHHDQLQYLSTDEELDDEILIDEYMPDYAYNQYLNNDEEDEEDEIIDDLDDEEISNRVVRRFAIREKLLLLEKSKKNKCGSTGERIQMTSSEEDDSGNSIKYDENLGIIINTTKRIKKQPSKLMKIDQKNNEIKNNAKNSSAKSKISNCKSDELRNSISNSTSKTNSNQNLKASSISNQIKRSETTYDVSGQKKIFHHNNFYNNFPSRTNKSPNENASILQQPKLFYFPNPDFKAAQQQQQLINSQASAKQPQYPQYKYHLGQQQIIKQQCELKRQKSTPNVNGKMPLNYHPLNYHPILIDSSHRKSGGSVELMHTNDEFHRKPMNLDSKFLPNLVYQRGRPVSMVNIQPGEHFRIAHRPDKMIYY